MIIDFHTHTFPDKIADNAIQQLGSCFHIANHIDGTADGLLTHMEQSGVDYSVVLPVVTSPGSTVKINDYALRSNEEKAHLGYLSLGGMHPDFTGYRQEIKRIKRDGLKGIKLHPAYQSCNMDDIRYLRIMDAAAEEDMIVVFHAGVDGGIPKLYANVEMALNIIERVPMNKLVLAHMGGWEQWDEVERSLCGAPVYFDTAACMGSMDPKPGDPLAKRRKLMDDEKLFRMIRKHGTKKVLFATDSPWLSQKICLEVFQNLGLLPEEKNQILYENAKELLEL